MGVGFFGHLLHLPRTPGLITQSPVLDLYEVSADVILSGCGLAAYLVRLFAAILATKVGIVRVTGAIAVLDPAERCDKSNKSEWVYHP